MEHDNIINESDNDNNDTGNNDNDNECNNTSLIHLSCFAISEVDPRKENIFHFVKYMLCPNIKLISFTTVTAMLNILIYLITLCFGLEQSMVEEEFLPPTDNAVYYGELDYALIKSAPYQVYRFVLSNYFHRDFLHTTTNVAALVIFGAATEAMIGTFKITLLYNISGILGGLVSLFIQPDATSVGASGCVCGLVGVYFMYAVINWKNFEKIFGSGNKCWSFYLLLILLCLVLIAQLLFSSDLKVVSHIAGIVFGALLLPCVSKPKFNDINASLIPFNVLYYVSLIICIGFTVIGFFVFYYM